MPATDRMWRPLATAAAAAAIGWVAAQPEWWGARPAFILAGLALAGPALVTSRAFFGRSPAALGLGLGERRLGSLLLVGGIPLAALAGWIGSGAPALAAEYPLDRTLTREAFDFGTHAVLYLVYYVGFEYLFRGYLVLGLAERIGLRSALLGQAVLATVFHLGKPWSEFVAAFPASLLFGFIAWRTKSIWYVVVAHWVVGVVLDWYLVGA